MPFIKLLYVLYLLVDEATNAIAMAEEEYPIVSGIRQAAASGLAHDQVQELTVQDDYTAKETPGRGLKDQEHHLVSDSNIEVLLIPSFSFNFVYVFFFLRYWLLKQSFCSCYQLKLKVLANKPIIWPLMVLEVLLKLNALR